MITLPYNVVQGAFEWFGLYVTETEHGLRISEGRVGRLENPLVITDVVDGGWYFAETSVVIDDEIKVDIVLDKEQQTLAVITRTEDEEYDDSVYDLLIPLARFEDNHWQVVRPQYKEGR